MTIGDECQSFWYDLSCDSDSARDSNVFSSLEECRALCSGSIDTEISFPATTAASTQWTSARSSPRPPYISTEKNHLREKSGYLKNTESSKFDRLAYMEAFRLKLNAFPEKYYKAVFPTPLSDTKLPLTFNRFEAAEKRATTSTSIESTVH
uniref:BPTI/Kunitz inhibitor domain-containing protein n=1 Tax=Heterorhabditis bacteriophora TaxID=37862 RepID=A0A1I7XVI4_HETBA